MESRQALLAYETQTGGGGQAAGPNDSCRPDLSDLAADVFRTLDVDEAAVFMLRPVGRTRLKRCVEIIGHAGCWNVAVCHSKIPCGFWRPMRSMIVLDLTSPPGEFALSIEPGFCRYTVVRSLVLGIGWFGIATLDLSYCMSDFDIMVFFLVSEQN
jgi:hypothetical protein